MSGRGRFITFEGPEGSGKSTQIRLLGARLRSAGREVLETQEPGGTPIGVQIRHVLLDSKNRELCPTDELRLMSAMRAQNVDEFILPALSAGRTVLSDRFTDSTLVYQGVGRGLGADLVYELDRIACRGLVPDLTLLIDIDAETGLTRAHHRSARSEDYETRSETRIEDQDVSFHRRVRDAYRQLAADESARVKLIDGSQTREAVAEQVWQAVEPLLAVTPA